MIINKIQNQNIIIIIFELYLVKTGIKPLKNIFLNFDTDKFYQSMKSEDLQKYQDELKKIKKRFKSDEHISSICRNHMNRIKLLLNKSKFLFEFF